MAGPLQIVAWDLETSNLRANVGCILCMGYQAVGQQRPKVISAADFPLYDTDPTNDREVVKAARKVLADADAWLTWYGARFDVPFFNTRLLFHRLPPLPPITHIDAWRTARYKMKLTSNRLKTVSEFLDIEEKTPILFKHWLRAMAGHRPSLRYIEKHCRQDITVLIQAYERLKPWIEKHPNQNLYDGLGCPTCGSARMVKRGEHVSLTRTYQRFQCMACGAWSRQAKSEDRTDMRGF